MHFFPVFMKVLFLDRQIILSLCNPPLPWNNQFISPFYFTMLDPIILQIILALVESTLATSIKDLNAWAYYFWCCQLRRLHSVVPQESVKNVEHMCTNDYYIEWLYINLTHTLSRQVVAMIIILGGWKNCDVEYFGLAGVVDICLL